MNDIFKLFSKLTTLDLWLCFLPTEENVLQWIKVADKLQTLSLTYPWSVRQILNIQAVTYRKLVEIVEKRDDNTRLDIQLKEMGYFNPARKNLGIAHKDLVTITYSAPQSAGYLLLE